MSEHLSFTTCQRLKAAGYPQRIPSFVWARDWFMGYVEFTDGLPDYGAGEWYACPPIITADGKGGVLPWLESKGRQWSREQRTGQLAITPYTSEGALAGWPIDGDSPEALIVAALDKMVATK